jgi:hypothetical protein
VYRTVPAETSSRTELPDGVSGLLGSNAILHELGGSNRGHILRYGGEAGIKVLADEASCRHIKIWLVLRQVPNQ